MRRIIKIVKRQLKSFFAGSTTDSTSGGKESEFEHVNLDQGAVGRAPTKGHYRWVRSAVLQEIGLLAREAENTASKGIDASVFIDRGKALVVSQRSLDRSDMSASNAALSAELASHRAELDHFDLPTRSEKIRAGYADVKQQKLIELTKEGEAADRIHHYAEQQEARASENYRNQLDRDGELSGKDFLFAHRRTIAVIVGCVDLGFTYTAFTLHSLPPLFAGFLALSISAFILLSVDGLAEAFYKGRKLPMMLWALVGLGTLAAIIVYRHGVDDHLMITGSVLVLFYLGAILIGWRNKPFEVQLLSKALKDAAERESASTAADVVAVEQEIEGLDELYAQKAAAEVASCEADLRLRIEALENTISALGSEISEMNLFYDGLEKEAESMITAGIQTGKAMAYTPPKGSRFAGRVAVIFLAMACMAGLQGCDQAVPPAQFHRVYVYIDQSGSFSKGDEQGVVQLSDYIFEELLSLDETYKGDRRVEVLVCSINGFSLSKGTPIVLESGGSYWLRDLPSRAEELSAFKSDLKAGIQALYLSDRAPGGTNLYRSTALGMMSLNDASEVTHKEVVIVSDCIEEGNVVRFPDFLTPENLHANRNTIMSRLKEDVAMSLDGLEITIMLQSSLEHESFSYESALVFRDLWLSQGARKVHLQHSF